MWTLLFYHLCLLGTSAVQARTTSDKKCIGLFCVVQFDNDQCVTDVQESPVPKGTCYTAEECTSKGGTASGKCASGFGVCCYFRVDETKCNTDVSQNGTYVQNLAYPGSTRTNNINCRYNFVRESNICQIRFDFDSVVLSQPGTTAPVRSCNDDSITITAGGGYFYTPLCGTLTGTHMYVETGRKTAAGSIVIATKTSTTFNRKWKIHTTFYECEQSWKAPADCLQYLTGRSNSFQSFNFQGGAMISNLQYDICIRQEAGFCKFQLYESSTTTDSFTLDSASFVATESDVGDQCTEQFITVNAYEPGTNMGRYCGGILNLKTGNTKSGVVIGEGPIFRVGVASRNEPTRMVGVGFDLTYSQVPCSN